MKALILAAVATLAIGGPPALAAGGAPGAAGGTHLPDWNGAYAGASLGYGFGSSKVTIDSLNDVGRSAFVSPALADNPKGFLGGATLGLNWQVQSLVYGLEADLSLASIRDRVVGPLLLPPFDFQTTNSQRLQALGTMRGRAGLVLPGGSLLYGTGGLAFGRGSLATFAIDTSANVCNSPPKFCVAGTATKWKAGWTAGGGWEVPIAPKWRAKVEYLYYSLDSVKDGMNDGLAPPQSFQGGAPFKGSVVRLGANYAFDSK